MVEQNDTLSPISNQNTILKERFVLDIDVSSAVGIEKRRELKHTYEKDNYSTALVQIVTFEASQPNLC